MKKITIFGSIAIAMLTCIGFTACNNDVIETPEPETYTVKLGWAGEILDVSYEPMPESASSTVEWTSYATGLFNDPDNIIITLRSGAKYRFIATLIRNGKNRINHGNNDYYSWPFMWSLSNEFNYGTDEFGHIDLGFSYLSDYSELVDRPNVERFYGELSGYIPCEGNSNVEIAMKRTSFGAKFIAGGKLAVDGKLEIQIEGAPKMKLALTDGADEISDIFTFYNVAAAWANNNYTEDIDVSLNWIRPDGTTQPLGTHKITYKRNTTTVVEVNIDKDGNDEGVDLEIPDSETGSLADGNTVTINDGEMQ